MAASNAPTAAGSGIAATNAPTAAGSGIPSIKAPTAAGSGMAVAKLTNTSSVGKSNVVVPPENESVALDANVKLDNGVLDIYIYL
jgi:hypothetical protein